MIVRLWQERTPSEMADACAGFLNQRAIPGYRSVPGNYTVYILRRDERDAAHFDTFTLSESHESIRSVAGSPTERCDSEDQDSLLEFERQVMYGNLAGGADSE